MMNRKIFSSLQLVHASVVIACVGVRKKRGLANLRLTVGSRSLRSISRLCFFLSIFSIFFVVFRFWKFFYKRNFGERKFFDEKFWRPKKISSKKRRAEKNFKRKKIREQKKIQEIFLYH